MADANGRFYDPQFGVFLSPDPVSPLGGSSPRMNRYAYVGYDPVNFTDPSGYILAPLLFSLPALGTLATIAGTIGSINFLSTGEFKLTWDENTTEGAVTLLVASAAGAGCGLAAGPIVAGFCAGFAGGATAAAFAPRRDFGSILTGGVVGSFIGAAGSTAGVLAGGAALSLTESHLVMAFAETAATSGTGVGFQLALGSEVNWTIVAAQAVVSGALAFHRAAELDAAAMQAGQAAGRAANGASRSAAGLTRAATEIEGIISQSASAQVAGAVVLSDGRINIRESQQRVVDLDTGKEAIEFRQTFQRLAEPSRRGPGGAQRGLVTLNFELKVTVPVDSRGGVDVSNLDFSYTASSFGVPEPKIVSVPVIPGAVDATAKLNLSVTVLGRQLELRLFRENSIVVGPRIPFVGLGFRFYETKFQSVELTNAFIDF